MSLWGRLAGRLDGMTDVAHAWDVRAMEAISSARVLSRCSRAFVIATYLGDGYLWAGLALGLLLFGQAIDRWNVLLGFAVSSVNFAIFQLLKHAIARERPEAIAEGLRSKMIDSYSFPSGHATTAFGLAWVVSACYPHPAVQGLVYTAAATIAFSRVYVREHFFFDVLAGATLGTLVAVGLLPFFRWLVF